MVALFSMAMCGLSILVLQITPTRTGPCNIGAALLGMLGGLGAVVFVTVAAVATLAAMFQRADNDSASRQASSPEAF